MTGSKMIKSALESMLFVWGQLLPAKEAAEVLDITEKESIKYFEELMSKYEQEGRGIKIRRMNKRAISSSCKQAVGQPPLHTKYLPVLILTEQ